MFKHRITEQVTTKTYFDWFLLAFLSGSVNAGGWIACQRFVTHVTGFATLTGYDAALGRWHQALGMLTVPIYFLFGSMISAYWIDRRVHDGKSARFDWVMALITVLLATAALGGAGGFFGEFGSEVNLRTDYLFLALLCAASGLQNAAVTSASSSTLRTTHMTGITTDLGIGLIRMASLPKGNKERRVEAKVNVLRIGTIGSFILGGAVGSVLFIQYRYLGFLMPAAIALYATLMAWSDRRLSAGTTT